MNGVALELEETLRGLDARSAAALERAVRGVLALAAERPALAKDAVDANGYPIGYFEQTAGAFANEPFDIPDDPPPGPTPEW